MWIQVGNKNYRISYLEIDSILVIKVLPLCFPFHILLCSSFFLLSSSLSTFKPILISSLQPLWTPVGLSQSWKSPSQRCSAAISSARVTQQLCLQIFRAGLAFCLACISPSLLLQPPSISILIMHWFVCINLCHTHKTTAHALYGVVLEDSFTTSLGETIDYII